MGGFSLGGRGGEVVTPCLLDALILASALTEDAPQPSAFPGVDVTAVGVSALVAFALPEMPGSQLHDDALPLAVLVPRGPLRLSVSMSGGHPCGTGLARGSVCSGELTTNGRNGRMSSGAITDQHRAFTEEWQSVTDTSQYVIRFDVRGDEEHQLVPSNRVFQITTEERMVTEARIASPKNNPFRNGLFRPVTVPEDLSIESNPNALSIEDIERLLGGSDLAWNEYMEVIDSEVTFRRMLETAERMVAEGRDVSMIRYNQVKAALAVLSPRRSVAARDQEEFDDSQPKGEKSRGGKKRLSL